MARFSEDEIRRYSRQILLPEVGGHGQALLRAATPWLLCTGTAGEVAARYLLRAGVVGLRLWAPDPADAARLQADLADDVPEGAAVAVAAVAVAPAGHWLLAAPTPDGPTAGGPTPDGPAPDAPTPETLDASSIPRGWQDLVLWGLTKQPLLWAACTSAAADVGTCCPCARTVPAGAAPGVANPAMAWLGGAQLAWLAVQELLRPVAPRRPRPGPGVLRASATDPLPTWHAAPPCSCPLSSSYL